MEKREEALNEDNSAAERELKEKEKKQKNEEFIIYYSNKNIDKDMINK